MPELKIDINFLNKRMTRLLAVDSPKDIDAALKVVTSDLHRMFDSRYQQEQYQRDYGIIDSELVMDFNGDMLYMAMGIRMLDAADMVRELGMSEDIYIGMDEGRILPCHQHLEKIAKLLQFPITFFTRDGDVDREHKHTFICYAHDYGDE